jgi:RNA recognition motif-containing protein
VLILARYAYIQYATAEEAASAITTLDGHLFAGRKLALSKSRPPPKRNVQGEAEANTAFVSGLPRVDNIRELLTTRFAECGEPCNFCQLCQLANFDTFANLANFAYSANFANLALVYHLQLLTLPFLPNRSIQYHILFSLTVT